MIRVAGDDWGRRANCKGCPPDRFFGSGNGGSVPRKNLPCAGCPVAQQCLEFALEGPWEPAGIWGGLSQTDVRKLWYERHPATRGLDERVLPYLGMTG